MLGCYAHSLSVRLTGSGSQSSQKWGGGPLRQPADLSPPKIGQQFGGRDHTTVINADRKIRSLMAERRSIYTQVTELTNRIKQQARTS